MSIAQDPANGGWNTWLWPQIPPPSLLLNHILDGKVDLETRSIYMSTYIEGAGEDSDDWRGWITSAFRFLDKTPGAIKLFINTPGGDEVGQFMLYDLIRTAANPVITIGIGEVCSAGVLLLVAGHRRIVTENCVLMSHEGRGGMSDDLSSSEMKARMKLIDFNEERWTELMARHTPKDKATWRRITKKEAELWLLGGQAIVDEGLADAVVPAERGTLDKAIAEAEAVLSATS